MIKSSYKAPGSLMLLGEHAVLHGKWALVGAIDRFITASVHLRQDDKIIINSSLAYHEGTLQNLGDHPSLRFVIEALRLASLEHGIEIIIDSDIAADQGLGSSAAVTVATLGALFPSISKKVLFHKSLEIVKAVQGQGSGADVAAAVYGNIIAYRADPLAINPLRPFIPPITVIYSGHKVPTPEVIKRVEGNTALDQQLWDKIDQCTQLGIKALVTGDLGCLGKAFVDQQRLMEQMNLSTPTIDAIIQSLSPLPAKISGSGLGDCVIGLGAVETYKGPGVLLPVSFLK